MTTYNGYMKVNIVALVGPRNLMERCLLVAVPYFYPPRCTGSEYPCFIVVSDDNPVGDNSIRQKTETEYGINRIKINPQQYPLPTILAFR